MSAEKSHLPETRKTEEVTVERTRNVEVFSPDVDIYEQDDGLMLVADLPGVDETTLRLTLENGELALAGRVSAPVKPGLTLGYHEYHVGDYYRTFSLSEEVDQGKIHAEIKHGVLRVFLPLTERAKPRSIPVKGG